MKRFDTHLQTHFFSALTCFIFPFKLEEISKQQILPVNTLLELISMSEQPDKQYLRTR